MTVVPFLDLRAQYGPIKAEIQQTVHKVLDDCAFILGEEVAAFEKEFATYCDSRYGVAVNSGTSALHLALLAAGVGPGDEVITVPFTFVATVAAILYTGARPVLVDVDPCSLTIDVDQLASLVTKRTKAVVPVHLHGQAADMDPIMEVAQEHGLKVIEDAAQAHGAEYKGRRVGSIGDLGCFSFYPGKNLGAYGEGGMVVTNNLEYTRLIQLLRDWGQDRKYSHILKGYNYRLEGLQGAILRVKLRHLEEWTEMRRAHATRYTQLLKKTEVQTPVELDSRRHVYHVYSIRTPQRDIVQAQLHARGIQTGIHYPVPVHLQPAYSDLGYEKGAFPHSERAAKEVLSLPMYAELTHEQQDLVVDAVRQIRESQP